MSNKQRDIQTSIDTSILAGEFSKYLKEIASDIPSSYCHSPKGKKRIGKTNMLSKLVVKFDVKY